MMRPSSTTPCPYSGGGWGHKWVFEGSINEPRRTILVVQLMGAIGNDVSVTWEPSQCVIIVQGNIWNIPSSLSFIILTTKLSYLEIVGSKSHFPQNIRDRGGGSSMWEGLRSVVAFKTWFAVAVILVQIHCFVNRMSQLGWWTYKLWVLENRPLSRLM